MLRVYSRSDSLISTTDWTTPTFDAPVALFVGGGGASYDFRVENTKNTLEDPFRCGGFKCGLERYGETCQDVVNEDDCVWRIFEVPYQLFRFQSDGVEPFNNWTLTLRNPSIEDIGSLPIRIECSLIDHGGSELYLHKLNRFSNEFILEVIDL